MLCLMSYLKHSTKLAKNAADVKNFKNPYDAWKKFKNVVFNIFCKFHKYL